MRYVFARPLSPGWTELEEEELQKLLNLRYTAKQISDMLPGRTRNAIIGKCHRESYELQSQLHRPKDAPRTPPKVKIKRVKKLKLPPKEIVDRPWLRGRVLGPHHTKRRLPVPANPRRLTELPFRSCKFPVARGEDGEWLLCADPQHVDSAYCRPHHAECYQPRQPRRHR